MSKQYTGHCACGQVTYGFGTEPTFVANCHCEIFTWNRQKWARPLDLPQFDHGPS